MSAINFYLNQISELPNFPFLLVHSPQEILNKIALIYPFIVGPTSGGVVALKTGRRVVPRSNPGRACRPSPSEFLWFSPKLE